jgi:hypothetical protein
MCLDGSEPVDSKGPEAMAYLALAYVASPASTDVPTRGARPRDPRTEAYLKGFFALPQASPEIKVLAPRRFYDALNDAQQAQLGHFLLWCARNEAVHQLDVSAPDEVTGEVTITGWYQPHGTGSPEEASWTYDGVWRGGPDSQAVMRSARAEAGLDAVPPAGAPSAHAELPEPGSLH